MSRAYDTLAALRDKLATVPGVATCKIGLEANMTPADYPMVRIVPGRLANGQTLGRRQHDVLIYFGRPIHEFTSGLEGLYAEMLDLEEALIAAMRSLQPGVTAHYRDTIADEDRIDAYKLMAIRATVTG